jgi:hypothetical protein
LIQAQKHIIHASSRSAMPPLGHTASHVDRRAAGPPLVAASNFADRTFFIDADDLDRTIHSAVDCLKRKRQSHSSASSGEAA